MYAISQFKIVPAFLKLLLIIIIVFCTCNKLTKAYHEAELCTIKTLE